MVSSGARRAEPRRNCNRLRCRGGPVRRDLDRVRLSRRSVRGRQGAPASDACLEPRVIVGLATDDGLLTARSSFVVIPAASLQVERRTDLTLDPADRESFEAILQSRPSVGAFVSTAWLSGFFDEPADGADLSFLVFREGRTMRGFLPIAVRTALGLTRVTLLGGGLGSDRIDLMAARGAEPACADLFLTWLAQSFGRTGFVLELRDVPADSPLWGAAHRSGISGGPQIAVSLQE